MADEFIDTTADVTTSKYNSAVDQIKRIGFLWEKTTNSVLKGDFSMWNMLLDRIWAELVADLDKKEKSEREDWYDQIKKSNEDIVKLYPLKTSEPQGFNPRPKDYAILISKQYQTLFTKELILRRLQNYLGKGTKWSDGDEEDFI